jgi:hypothetical protein
MSIEPLEDDLAAIVRDERALDVAPNDARAQLRTRLAKLDVPSGGGSGVTRSPFRVPPWTLGAALVVGAGLGAGAMALRAPAAPVERVVYVDRIEAPSTSVSATSAIAIIAPASPTTSATPRATSSTPDVNDSDAQLAAERRELDVARTALGRGEGDNALAACDRHQRAFPRGKLSEEREVIAIQALVLVHRDADAKRRADRFRAAYPHSMLLPAAEAATQGIP